jgi:hypothetical protein
MVIGETPIFHIGVGSAHHRHLHSNSAGPSTRTGRRQVEPNFPISYERVPAVSFRSERMRDTVLTLIPSSPAVQVFVMPPAASSRI